ncbi:MAG: multicopper oxidase domain-containing protein [Gemmatimonadaceae bacterium]
MTAVFIAALLLTGCSDDPTDPLSNTSASLRTRTYYIAADVVLWDYAPGDRDRITGIPFDEHPHAGTFVLGGEDRIGSTYYKILYREYSDASFTTLKKDADAEYRARWAHLGAVGPAILAQVGDTIRVVFRNNSLQPVSVHPHGVFYDKDSEGASYCHDPIPNAPCVGLADDAVPAGQMVTYVWLVPERAGPAKVDGSSIMWMYHSHTDEVMDTNTGLAGPIIITERGKMTESGRPVDVDREFVFLYTVFNENDSWLLDRNIETFAGDPATVDHDDDEFFESNLMHSINGWVYGYQPLESVTMKKGERVRWYMFALGTEVDLHTPHWHGQSGVVMGVRTDIIELLPASMKVFDMEPDNPGTWLFHCHVNDHINAGMLTRFVVQP